MKLWMKILIGLFFVILIFILYLKTEAGEIEGYVYNDTWPSSVSEYRQQIDLPFDQTQITLYTQDEIIQTSSESGQYFFNELDPGTYFTVYDIKSSYDCTSNNRVSMEIEASSLNMGR